MKIKTGQRQWNPFWSTLFCLETWLLNFCVFPALVHFKPHLMIRLHERGLIPIYLGVFYRFHDAGGTLGVKIVFYYGNKGNGERQNSTLGLSLPPILPWVEVLWLLAAYQLTPQLSPGPVTASLCTLLEENVIWEGKYQFTWGKTLCISSHSFFTMTSKTPQASFSNSY